MAEIRLNDCRLELDIARSPEAYSVSVYYQYDASRAGNTDNPGDTIDAMGVLRTICSFSTSARWQTIEGYAASLLNQILQTFPRLDGVSITVSKQLKEDATSIDYTTRYSRYD